MRAALLMKNKYTVNEMMQQNDKYQKRLQIAKIDGTLKNEKWKINHTSFRQLRIASNVLHVGQYLVKEGLLPIILEVIWLFSRLLLKVTSKYHQQVACWQI